MELFYTNWFGGITKHDAFTNAQKEMRKIYAPYYWAAFVLVE
jgi:CHAT domain-containing protein